MNRLKRAKRACHAHNQASAEARELEMGASKSQADLWAEGREDTTKVFSTLKESHRDVESTHKESNTVWIETP